MHKTNIISGAIFSALAASFMIGAYGYGIGYAKTDNVPEAGFFPFFLGLIVLLLGIALMVQGVTHKGGRDDSFLMDAEQKRNLWTFFLTIGALLVSFGLWSIPTPTVFLDYYLTSFEPAALFLCIALNAIYRRSWKFNIPFSIFVVLLIHLLFVRMLSISFDI